MFAAIKASDYCILFDFGSFSGLSDFSGERGVIEAVNKINFTAPLTMVGAFAGISISDQIKSFFKAGWKMILIGILVMTGTFLGSALIAQIILSLTHAI